MMKKTFLLSSFGILACAPQIPVAPYIPSMRYSQQPNYHPVAATTNPGEENGHPEMRGQLRMVDGDIRPEVNRPPAPRMLPSDGSLPGNNQANQDLNSDVYVQPSSEMVRPPYKSSLDIGDPGVSASLWRESRAGNDIVRDNRAWQAMDLLTIVVTENSKGEHDADTEIKSKSTMEAAIENLLGFEQQTQNWKYPPDLASLINATTKNEFKGEGNTSRKSQLTARISAVVVEVLPSDVLRIEGEKIISVNNEEQVMVISGLVRPRDVTSDNEIDSARIAQMRIDYYGKGIVGEAQRGGWLGRLLRTLWPF